MSKFQPEGADLPKWFQDLKNQVHTRTFQLPEVEAVVYKGFKITRNNVTTHKPTDYFIYDITKTDLATAISKSSLSSFINHGIVKGIDLVSLGRSQRQLQDKRDELSRVLLKIDEGSTVQYLSKKREEVEAEIASLELKISRTINKYKLNGK